MSSLLLVYIVVIGGVFIFMTSRGNRKRQSTAQQLQSALVVGAEVRTIGGMVGEVIEVTDEHVVIETTPGTRLKFVKTAVAGVVPPAEPETEQAEETEHDGESDQDEAPEAEAAAEHTEPSDTVPAPAAEAGAAGTNAEADDVTHDVVSEPAKR